MARKRSPKRFIATLVVFISLIVLRFYLGTKIASGWSFILDIMNVGIGILFVPIFIYLLTDMLDIPILKNGK